MTRNVGLQEVDPTFIITHTMELSRGKLTLLSELPLTFIVDCLLAAEAYKMFHEKSDGTM